jgi:hypothetical protein
MLRLIQKRKRWLRRQCFHSLSSSMPTAAAAVHRRHGVTGLTGQPWV